MTFLKSKLQSSIKSGKIKIFLLFLLVSFSILLLTKLSKDYVKTVAFEVKTLNLPEDKVIINDTTHKINVTLKTYGFKLLRYYFSNPKLAIDLSMVQKSKQHFLWTSNSAFEEINSQFTSNVEIINIQPDSMVFSYDINDVKWVPIILNQSISFAPGFNLTERFKLEPDSMKVIGPKALIDTITAVQTEVLTLDRVSKTIQESVIMVRPEPIQDINISANKVLVTGFVDKFTEGSMQVPITLINKPKGVSVNYFPKQVNVLFYTSLSNYKDVKPKDFVVVCDFNDLSANASYLTPKIVTQPTTVKTAKINQNKIEFILSQ